MAREPHYCMSNGVQSFSTGIFFAPDCRQFQSVLQSPLCLSAGSSHTQGSGRRSCSPRPCSKRASLPRNNLTLNLTPFGDILRSSELSVTRDRRALCPGIPMSGQLCVSLSVPYFTKLKCLLKLQTARNVRAQKISTTLTAGAL